MRFSGSTFLITFNLNICLRRSDWFWHRLKKINFLKKGKQLLSLCTVLLPPQTVWCSARAQHRDCHQWGSVPKPCQGWHWVPTAPSSPFPSWDRAARAPHPPGQLQGLLQTPGLLPAPAVPAVGSASTTARAGGCHSHAGHIHYCWCKNDH